MDYTRRMSNAGAPKGNKNALVAANPTERRALCLEYLQHVEMGLSDKSFPGCDIKTIKYYIEHFPEDFPLDEIERARRVRERNWELLGLAGSSGKVKGFNANSWKFNMQNRFGWRESSMVEVKKPQEMDDERLNEVFFGFMGQQEEMEE